MLNRLDFRQRYDLVVLTSIAITGFLILLSLYIATLKYTSDYTRQYWQDYTHTFAHSIKYSVILHSASVSKAILQNYAADKNVLKVSVYVNPHTLLASSGKQSFECSVKKHTSVLVKPLFLNNGTFWCFYTPLYQNERYLGYVELVVSTNDLDSFMHEILFISGLIVLVVLMFFFLVVRRFSGIFTAPMLEIVDVLKNVGLGNRGHRVCFSGAPDIERMSTDFNDMLSKIESNKQLLEQAVADRTSELKIALDSSRAANNYKNQIMTLVSHEMKTPLHSIGSYLELIQESLPNTSDFDLCRSFHANALLRTQNLNDLINKVLVHGKLEANKVELSLQSIDIKLLVQECATKLAPVLANNRNHLSLSGNTIMIISDADVLRHIVENLLSNACKFTLDGDISLSWQQDASNLIIKVRDSGQGIPAQYHHHIFEAFWQADMSLTREHGGHGLGLSITKRFIELLGGSITVFSKIDQGSLFTVKIPV